MLKKLIIPILCVLQLAVAGQNYKIDTQGILRDPQGKEAAFFGFNYCMPFAHGYRSHGILDTDRKTAIDRDIYHMTRLGINAFRIHVWDVEISDGEGNLLENDHLDLLDYTIARFAQYGVQTLVTAIAFWGNGWPEEDDKTLPGFSNQVTKQQATVDEKSIAAQERYLKALMNHQNPYTGYSYKNDPAIVAVELNNEPDHTANVPDKTVTAYIDRLAKAVRTAGCRKPIVYNITQNPERSQAVTTARIDGVSGQWYPPGLVGGKKRHENFLPTVSHYNLPYDTRGKARFIYEFDAADIDGSYIYPAMARSFREAGFQWATQFAYDPLAMAAYNTDYQTHWINLVYTPAKAISLRIAAEVFRSLPRGKNFGDYPENNRFADFNVSYIDDLSVLNRDTLFCYSNTTEDLPVAPERLRHIAGHGSSPIVKSNGSGAYFLDKQTDGNWRIEIYPDITETTDPYSRHNSLNRKIALAQSNTRQMQICLPDIHTQFDIRPGIYLLQKEGKLQNITNDTPYPVIEDDVKETAVFHTPAAEWNASTPATVTADIVSPAKIDSVVLYGTMWYGESFKTVMQQQSGFTYTAELPSSFLRHGIFRYRIGVYTGKGNRIFPGNCDVKPGAWNDYCKNDYHSNIITSSTPAILLDAQNKPESVELVWQPGIRFAYLPEGIGMKTETTDYRGEAALVTDALFAPRPLNQMTIEAIITEKPAEARLELLDRDGFLWCAETPLQNGKTTIALSDFKATEIRPVRELYPGISFRGGIRSDRPGIRAEEITSVRFVLKKGDVVIQKISLGK